MRSSLVMNWGYSHPGPSCIGHWLQAAAPAVSTPARASGPGGQRSTGPSCRGSPASTSCPPGLSVSLTSINPGKWGGWGERHMVGPLWTPMGHTWSPLKPLTCYGHQALWLHGMASLVDEDVCEVIDGKLGRDQPGRCQARQGSHPDCQT